MTQDREALARITQGKKSGPTVVEHQTAPDHTENWSFNMAKAIVSGNEIDRIDRLNNLNQKIAQLESVLAMTHGDAGESFRNMSDDLQDNYLWTCKTLASECKELASGLSQPGIKVAPGGTAQREATHG